MRRPSERLKDMLDAIARDAARGRVEKDLPALKQQIAALVEQIEG